MRLNTNWSTIHLFILLYSITLVLPVFVNEELEPKYVMGYEVLAWGVDGLDKV